MIFPNAKSVLKDICTNYQALFFNKQDVTTWNTPGLKKSLENDNKSLVIIARMQKLNLEAQVLKKKTLQVTTEIGVEKLLKF